MKLWELSSIVRDNALLQTVAQKNPAWRELGALYARMDQLVQVQDRATLDRAVSEDFVLAALGATGQKCYRSHDGWLRSAAMSPTDQVLSFSDAYEKYGGTVLENALERGAVKVQG